MQVFLRCLSACAVHLDRRKLQCGKVHGGDPEPQSRVPGQDLLAVCGEALSSVTSCCTLPDFAPRCQPLQAAAQSGICSGVL